MNYSKYRFNLDMQSYISQISLPVRQHDTGIVLRINLTDGGVPYVIRDGCRAVFYARKSDGNPLMNDCIIEKNTTICYELTQQTTSCSGVVDCEVRLYGSDGNLITTPRFILVIDSRVVHDEDFPLSEAEQTVLDNIILSEQKRQKNEEQREETYEKMLDTVEKASTVADTLTEKLATGDYNGITPHVGDNRNWWFDDEDTGILARGITPHIGANGNWWFDDEDTGVEADAGKHTHSAADINEGILPITRGGTGATSVEGILKNLGLWGRWATMSTGTAIESNVGALTNGGFRYELQITLDFSPKMVFVLGTFDTIVYATEDNNKKKVEINNGLGWAGFVETSDNNSFILYRTTNNYDTSGAVKAYDFIAIGNSAYETPTPDTPEDGGDTDGEDTTSITFYVDYSFQGSEKESYTVTRGTTWREFVDQGVAGFPFNIDDMMGGTLYEDVNGVYLNKNGGRTQTADMVIEEGAIYYGSKNYVTDDVTLVTFTISNDFGYDPMTYTVEAGTTWEEWADASYSEVDGMYEWIVSGGYIENNFIGGVVFTEGNVTVSPIDVIVSGNYVLQR